MLAKKYVKESITTEAIMITNNTLASLRYMHRQVLFCLK